MILVEIRLWCFKVNSVLSLEKVSIGGDKANVQGYSVMDNDADLDMSTHENKRREKGKIVLSF